MIRVAIACRGIEQPSWTAACGRFCRTVLSRLGKTGWEVSLLLCDDETIRELNARFRKIDRPTDVLSFSQTEGDAAPSSGDAVTAGDVVISLDRLAANARRFGVTEDEELKRLLVHGFLHLSGRDHTGDGPEAPMLAEQEALLEELRDERILTQSPVSGRKRPAQGPKRSPGRSAAKTRARNSRHTHRKHRPQKRRK
ncbi:MAG: rRNA maturation RNase YbeY [Spirochaetales bacterium]|nr:rRNA maturation RNase YbeY [Spirochaetales bacterium]